MKFFDAQKRAKTYKEKEINVLELEMLAQDYLNTPLGQNLDNMKLFKESDDFKNCAANHIIINLKEEGEYILTDLDITNIFSDIIFHYSDLFEAPKFRVSSPSNNLINKVTLSPAMLFKLVSGRVVTTPIQITLKRNYYKEDEIIDKEEVTLI